MSRASVLATAMAVALLASPIGLTDAVAKSNKRKTSYRQYYSPPRLPPVATFRTNTNSQPRTKKFDDDDRSETKTEPRVSGRPDRNDDDDDDRSHDARSHDDRDRSRSGDPSDVRSEEAIPSTVVEFVKRLMAPRGDPPPAVGPGRREPPPFKVDLKANPSPKVETRPSSPAKPLQKLTGRHTGDLPLKLPDMRATDILVRNLSPATLRQALESGMKVATRRDLGLLGFSLTRLVVPPDMSASQAKSLLQQASPQQVVDLNQHYRLYPSAREGDGTRPGATNEPARPTGGCVSDRCYGAATIGWQEKLATCARGLSVGLIDTGFDSTHPSLSQHLERIKFGQFGPGFRGASSDLHGTGVLALLAGSTKSSTPGLIPSAKFYVADIFFADENGLPVSTTLHLLEALEWMDRFKVQIINLSLSGPRDDLVQAAIALMSRARTVDGVAKPPVVFVAAAGNGGPGAPPSYPAAYPEALAVTAVNRDLRGYRRANQGNYIDVAAPGVNIWTALPDGRQGFQTGTSFAAPFMTAVVASLYRTLPAGHKRKEAILERISVQDLGPPGRDRIYGRGLVQAPAGCGPSMPWSPAVVSRARPAAPVQKTASR